MDLFGQTFGSFGLRAAAVDGVDSPHLVIMMAVVIFACVSNQYCHVNLSAVRQIEQVWPE